MMRTARQLAGDSLEKEVAQLLRKLGKWQVKVDTTLIDQQGNTSQIDITFREGPSGFFRKRFVECKNFTNSNVALADVAKFKEVCALNGLPPNRGLFVTTSSYAPRATTIGIECWDGNKLREMQKIARSSRALRGITTGFTVGGALLLATAAATVGAPRAEVPEDIYSRVKRHGRLARFHMALAESVRRERK